MRRNRLVGLAGLVTLMLLLSACPADEPEVVEPPEEPEVEEPEVEEPEVEEEEPAVELPRTVTIVVGYAPGGSYGIAAELVARHLPQYLPGNPNITLDYRPGAASLLAANTVYEESADDPAILITFNSGTVLEQAMGVEAVTFDGRRYNFLGSLREARGACFAGAHSPVQSIDELIGGDEFFISSPGPLSTLSVYARVANELIGTNFAPVEGYDGLAEAVLALEAEEVDGLCVSADNSDILARLDAEPPVRPILIVSRETPDVHPAYEGVPLITDFDLTDDEEALLDGLLAAYESTFVPFAIGPDVSPDVVEVYRRGFEELFNDPDFIAAFEATGSPLRPRTGEELQGLLASVLDLPPDVLDRLAEAVLP